MRGLGVSLQAHISRVEVGGIMSNEKAVVEFDSKANHALNVARAMVVDCPEAFEQGNKFLGFLRECEREAKATFDPVIKAAKEAKDRHYKPVLEAYDIAKGKLSAYAEVLEVKRLELEREANDKARKEAEDRRIEEAAQAEAQGRSAEARHLISTPVAVAPVIVPREVKVDGRIFRKTYGAEVFDLQALVLAVAESIKSKDGKYPLIFLEPNASSLNAEARSRKEELSIPGVRLVIR